jgi:hypothetical protein
MATSRPIYEGLKRFAIKTGLREPILRLLGQTKRYVVSDPVGGLLQFELLKRQGCVPH